MWGPFKPKFTSNPILQYLGCKLPKTSCIVNNMPGMCSTDSSTVYALHCFVYYYNVQYCPFSAPEHMKQSVGTARACKSDSKIDIVKKKKKDPLSHSLILKIVNWVCISILRRGPWDQRLNEWIPQSTGRWALDKWIREKRHNISHY